MKLFGPISTRTVTNNEARERLDELLSFTGEEQGHRVVVERDGKPVAALISIADLARLDLFLREREQDFQVLSELSRAFDGIPDEEIEREALKAVMEIRAEARAKRREAALLNQ
jgi:PHD/YefM family antitoxin component YafN of YafNO toxin-antitoxin module